MQVQTLTKAQALNQEPWICEAALVALKHFLTMMPLVSSQEVRIVIKYGKMSD